MSVNPNDPRYRTGFDSYPGDFDSAGNLTQEGREAREYMRGKVIGQPNRTQRNQSLGDVCRRYYGEDDTPASHYHPDGTKKSGLD